MARIGDKRVGDILDYERDIKGKGLVRLRAGVGAGKNYWVRHLPEQYPNLQILMITSRKNVAQAEAVRLETDTKIYTSRLFDVEDRDWLEDVPSNLMVCTNAYIQMFFQKIYDKMDDRTHLWKKFDVIFVDEAHSLTTDASFADSSFYVERFLYHTQRFNPRCDIVMMTGTPEPIDWLFTNEAYSIHTDIDLYDQCVHLAPDIVSLMTKASAPKCIYKMWSKGERLIYFANSVRNMAYLITELMNMGIPENDIGIAYTSSENESLLPADLVLQREGLRNTIAEKSSLPQEVKIFITTSQNKEGISIEDDDIGYMFAESHQKSDLEQMAGRVRGNPETGTGLHALIVILDAPQHPPKESYVHREIDQLLVGKIEDVLAQHKKVREESGYKYSLAEDINLVHEKCPYLRYDYIAEAFSFFTARSMANLQKSTDEADFKGYLELFDQGLYYYSPVGARVTCLATGRSELREKWFPFSQLYLAPQATPLVMEVAQELVLFLKSNNLFETVIDKAGQDQVMNEITRLAEVHGKNRLGFGRKIPQTLRPALKHFGLTCKDASHRKDSGKIITYELQSNE